MANKPSVGFIGLGIMGLPMAGHILKAGYPLTVYNRTRSKTRSLEAEGAAVAASPQEVAENSRMIITMVSDSPDVEAVVAGPEGVLEGIRPDSVVMDMSTISPQVERDLDEQLRAKGCALVDARSVAPLGRWPRIAPRGAPCGSPPQGTTQMGRPKDIVL